MQKSFKLIGITAALMLTGAVCAGGADMHTMHDESAHWGLGISWDNYLSGTAPAAMLAYDYRIFEASLSAGYDGFISKNDGQSSDQALELTLELGFQHEFMEHFAFTYGAAGSYAIGGKRPEGEKNPWAVGPYIGLNWHPAEHFVLGFKLTPYMYHRDERLNYNNAFFRNGSIEAVYFF